MRTNIYPLVYKVRNGSAGFILRNVTLSSRLGMFDVWCDPTGKVYAVNLISDGSFRETKNKAIIRDIQAIVSDYM